MKLALHTATQKHLNAVVKRPKGAYLFTGSEGVGRRTAAVWLAKQLHCGNLAGCGVCHLIDTGAYGDFIVVGPTDASSIGIAQVQELLASLGKSRINHQGVRMVVIDQADRLTTEAQNSLLKTIEEPPADTVMVLLTHEETDVLTTIRSRCELVNFLPLTAQQIQEHIENELKVDPHLAAQIAKLSLGSVGMAITLTLDEALLQKTTELAQTVEDIRQATPFQRLLLASKLQEKSVDVGQFVGLLGSSLQQSLRQDTSGDSVRSLEALERFDRYLKANVNGRSAWSRLLLEL